MLCRYFFARKTLAPKLMKQINYDDDDDVNVVKLCTQIQRRENRLIRGVAKVIENLMASVPAVEFGPLHYRILGSGKACALCSAGS